MEIVDGLLCVFFMVIAIEFVSYTLLIPGIAQRPLHISPLDIYVGRIAYGMAYLLSLLRAPLGLLPYLVKLFIFFGLRIRYESAQSTYCREVINMLGDFVNLGLTVGLMWNIVGSPFTSIWPAQGGPLHFMSVPAIIFYLPIGAEVVRLVAERVPITWSALWQLLPHRKIAQTILARQQGSMIWRCVALCSVRYCRYYALSDMDRMRYVVCALKQRAMCDADMTKRLEYLSALRIISQQHGLRSGHVRDVARGMVFVHAVWTNDPWLLIGIAIRRTPWMFDPRYLRRPFYYMTEANVLATLLVLERARYSPPYAIFQFGHEIRVARLHFFYGLLRCLGIDVEYKVNADGTFQFDQWIDWLGRQFIKSHALPKQRTLYTDEEVIAKVLSREYVDIKIDKMDVAVRYTYPLKYVEEVLWEKIEEVKSVTFLRRES